VDTQAIAQAVLEATGISPTLVTETLHSASNPTLPYTCWFINFSEGTPTTLPRQLRLFGTIATATYLPHKTTIVQCNQCWMWHNVRSCARPPRCRLCGSTEHPEEGHSNHCGTPSPHLCPPRCLHCHGPHPADSTACPFRLQPGTTLSKSQRSEIRSSRSAEHLRTKTEAGCTPTLDQMAIDATVASTPAPSLDSAPQPPAQPSTPPPQSPIQHPPATTQAVRFEDRPALSGNRFNSLLNCTL
jgi:hypothetical protein